MAADLLMTAGAYKLIRCSVVRDSPSFAVGVNGLVAFSVSKSESPCEPSGDVATMFVCVGRYGKFIPIARTHNWIWKSMDGDCMVNILMWGKKSNFVGSQ